MSPLEVFRRLRAAWHALRQVPAVDLTSLSRRDADRILDVALSLAAIDGRWASAATTDEIRALRNATELALEFREDDWALVEAGGWPR